MGLEPARIYLDSCIAIYLVEEHQVYASTIEALLESRPDAGIFVSDLTVMECLVGPMRNGSRLLEDKFNRWFSDLTVLSFTSAVFVEAARLRARHPSLRSPDAIHLATALYFNCGEFWTNDTRLDKIAPTIVRNIL